MAELTKEKIIYKFSSGEIDILPVDCFPEFLTIVNALAQTVGRDLSDKEALGMPVHRMAQLTNEIEALIETKEFTQASVRLRELYQILTL